MPASKATVKATFKQFPATSGDVLVPAYGSTPAVYWAATNSIPHLGGTATFQPSPYVYDGANQITWDQATGGVAGATGTGVCPANYRLPTVQEYFALLKANATSFGTPAGYVNNVGAATPTEAAYATGTNPYYTNTRKADGSGWQPLPANGGAYPVSGQIFVTSGGTLFFPASGRTGGAGNQGTSGIFWASSGQSAPYYGFLLSFGASDVTPADVGYGTHRFSVRCVRSAN